MISKKPARIFLFIGGLLCGLYGCHIVAPRQFLPLILKTPALHVAVRSTPLGNHQASVVVNLVAQQALSGVIVHIIPATAGLQVSPGDCESGPLMPPIGMPANHSPHALPKVPVCSFDLTAKQQGSQAFTFQIDDERGNSLVPPLDAVVEIP